MFYYFGRKARLAGMYPAPEHELVIEPFAGSMAYTLHWRPLRAVGIDSDQNVCKVWRRICSMSSTELLAYPEPRLGSRITDRWCMMAGGSHGTAKAESYLWTERMQRDFRKQRRMAAKAVDYAKSISYRHGTFDSAPDVDATWFIDPPYQNIIRGYANHDINYPELAQWCLSRKGLIIVCEQAGADWLPFQPLKTIKGTNNKRTQEVVWVHRSTDGTS